MLTRVWVNSEDYGPVYFGLFEQVKYAFDQAGITIPFRSGMCICTRSHKGCHEL